ncbi:MAG TPA: hypothetical protein VMJ65_00660 [Solirubrobacteraceae bacterium]|nr:hypothetical protein [Solirubrobacteraceae bacterium]
MSKFEDRLWRDLVRKHGADLAQMTRPPAETSGLARARPRLLAGTSVALAVAGTAVALVLSAASSPPAFAVNRNSDGTVTVTLQKLAAIHGANARLAALGIRARLVVVSTGCTVKALPPAAVAAMKLTQSMAGRAAPQAAIARFDPREIPRGKTQVIPTYRIANTVHVATGHLIQGKAPVCISTVVAPPCEGQRVMSNGPLAPAVLADVHRRAAEEALKRFLAHHAAIARKSADSGNNGNSGNSGISGDSGISGNSGNTTSTAKPTQVPVPAWVVGCYVRVSPTGSPITGNSGNSGKSGNSGNS